MAANSSESNAPESGSLQSMLARLRGMMQALTASEAEREEFLPTWDATNGGSPAAAPDAAEAAVPEAAAANTGPVAEAVPAPEESAAPGEAPSEVSPQEVAPALSPPLCPFCQAPRHGEQIYCSECGWIFPTPAAADEATVPAAARERLRDRYEIGELLGERGGVSRFRALDHDGSDQGAVPVILLRAAVAEATATVVPAESTEAALPPEAEVVPVPPHWPSLAWEQALLERLQHPVLPRVRDRFVEDGFEYLVEELPTGRSLWDAWEDPAATAQERFGWLKQVAGVLYHLNQQQALLEALRPDIVVITPAGQPRLADLADLLPLPLPPNPPLRATCYTAPELVLSSDRADGRAAIYSFGAMLYALHLGRELTELDFELQGVPKPFLQRFPDAHPAFGRLISKTFCRDVNGRFPTEEAARTDPSGFTELIKTLEVCRQTLDAVHLEVAAWTTTGMVRTNNEDAFALLHAAEGRENQGGEALLAIVADGMGGYEAGEVAAAMAVRALRRQLIEQKAFSALSGEGVLAALPEPESNASPASDVGARKALLATALQEANREVYAAARTGPTRGMGCTVDVVYVDGRQVILGHVGDSRTYHLQAGRLVQVTQDQTWVQRMVDLGALSQQEAETHPRRSELQQAIGGRSEVEPALYDFALKAGDWVVICSDGLPTALPAEHLQELLLSAPSAEWAARRLINAVNLAGGMDNATVVVIRAT